MLLEPSCLPNSKVTTPMVKTHTQIAHDIEDYTSDSDFKSTLDMTPHLAQQKAEDLSYEISALIKIKERLEQQRERLIFMYCKT